MSHWPLLQHDSGNMVQTLHRIAHYFHRRHVPCIPGFLKVVNYLLFNCVIPPECEIGKGTVLWHHGLGVVMHPRTRIGRNCHIYNHVVLGGGNDGPNGPRTEIRIGDNVTIGAGAKVLCRRAPLVIGCNSTIGANAVVIDDVQDNVVVGGIPAKLLKQKMQQNLL